MSLKEFVQIERLGSGSFGTVYKVRRITDQKIYAMKKVNIARLGLKAKNNALNQIRILASLQSPNIVTYHEAFFEEKLDLLCIVMEFADGGDLSSWIAKAHKDKKPISEIQIWKALIQILHGIKDLHDKSILHRDLKTENIFLLDQGELVKIGDLNVSKVKNNDIAMTQTGTPYYASPEVWDDKPYDEQSDVWSIGCIIYQLTTLKPPFMGKDMKALYSSVQGGKYPKIPAFYSNQLSQVISKCLKVNQKQRPKVCQLLDNFTLKMYENICLCPKQKKNEEKIFLKTIIMPKNKKQLQQMLPKSNYQKQLDNQDTPPDAKAITQNQNEALLRHRNIKTEAKKQYESEDQVSNNLITEFTSEQQRYSVGRKIRSLPRTQVSLKRMKEIAEKSNKQQSSTRLSIQNLIGRKLQMQNQILEKSQLKKRDNNLVQMIESDKKKVSQKVLAAKKENISNSVKLKNAKLFYQMQPRLQPNKGKVCRYADSIKLMYEKLQNSSMKKKNLVCVPYF